MDNFITRKYTVSILSENAGFMGRVRKSAGAFLLETLTYIFPSQINGIALDNKSVTECEALLRGCRDSLSLSLMKVSVFQCTAVLCVYLCTCVSVISFQNVEILLPRVVMFVTGAVMGGGGGIQAFYVLCEQSGVCNPYQLLVVFSHYCRIFRS